MAAAAAFASNPAIQRRRPFGISIAGRRAAIASRASSSGVRRWERSASGKADEDSGADEVVSIDSGVPPARRPRATSKTLAGGDDPSLTFADHRRMCRAVQRCKNSDEVLALAASSLASWNHVTLAAAFVALASNARTKSSLGTLLDSQTYARMEEKAAHASVPALGARGVVNILHSVATLHQRQRRFFDRKSSPAPKGFNPSPDLALALDAAVERTAGHMRPREVAAALWSYAALDAAPLAPTLASSLTLAAARVLKTDHREVDHQGFELGAGAREVAGIATALAKLGVTLAVVDAGNRRAGDGNGAVMSSRDDRAVPGSNPAGLKPLTGSGSARNATRRGCRTPRFGGADVGDTTWEMLIIVAAATAAERDATAALHPAISRCAGEMTGQGAMNALWAYAEMAPRGFEPPTNGIDRGDPIHSAVDALYARLTCLATAEIDGEGNEDENENGADPRRKHGRNLNPAEAAGAFAACAKIKTRALVPDAPAATVRALCETACETADKMSAKEAANCAWARARFDSADDDARLETAVHAGRAQLCARLDDAIVRTAPRMNGRDVATVLWAYDALREGELRRLDGGREAWDSQAVQVPGGGVGRFPRSVADRAGMFAALDAALARTLPKMNGAELAQTPSCWRHRVEELREELGLRSVPAQAFAAAPTAAAADDDDVVVKV